MFGKIVLRLVGLGVSIVILCCWANLLMVVMIDLCLPKNFVLFDLPSIWHSFVAPKFLQGRHHQAHHSIRGKDQ
jgi:hypothetical protein